MEDERPSLMRGEWKSPGEAADFARAEQAKRVRQRRRAIQVALAVGCVLSAWFFRYEVVASGSGGEGGTVRAWQMDRWTGRVRTIFPNGVSSDWQ